MGDIRWLRHTGTLMTTERIDAYGGIQFSRAVLEQAAVELSTGGIPVTVDHDDGARLRVRQLVARVEADPKGFDRLLIEFEVHPEDVELIDTRRGLSAGVTEANPLQPLSPKTDPLITVAADYAWFADADVEELALRLVGANLARESIRTERFYQFSFVPDPQIIVEVSAALAQTIGSGLATNALWDGLKYLVRSRRLPAGGERSKQTRITLKVGEGAGRVEAAVESDDEAVIERALTAFESVLLAHAQSHPRSDEAAGSQLLVWDAAAGDWISRH